MQLKLISPAQAVEAVTNTRPNLATVWRWATKGVRGIRLETVVVGGRRLTTLEMVQTFIEATTAARNGSQPIAVAVAPKAREKQVEKASADLRNKCSKRTKTRA